MSHGHHGAHHHAPHEDIVYPAAIPFVLVHLACFGAIWTGVSAQALGVAAILYLVRMWAITAGYHRYFSHRSYKTSRLFQFLLAFLGQTSAQRGVIWWSAVHRHHHLHSDTPQDVHSPRHHGMWYAHVGWIFNPSNQRPDYGTVRDLTRYPELRLLDRHPYTPAAMLAVALWLWGGWQMLVVGFFWSTVVLYHCTFFINSLAHGLGSQRYLTGDDSRNNFLLALITLGEGWHNNHHHYQSSTRQGFRWWEVDVSYYVLKVMSWARLVWDLRAPPEAIVRGERPAGRKVVEKVAGDLVAAFNVDALAAAVRERWDESHVLEDLSAWAQRKRQELEDEVGALMQRGRDGLDDMEAEMSAWAARQREALEARLAELTVPHLPTIPELRERAEELFQESPSLDEIVNRAHELLARAVASRLAQTVPLPA